MLALMLVCTYWKRMLGEWWGWWTTSSPLPLVPQSLSFVEGPLHPITHRRSDTYSSHLTIPLNGLTASEFKLSFFSFKISVLMPICHDLLLIANLISWLSCLGFVHFFKKKQQQKKTVSLWNKHCLFNKPAVHPVADKSKSLQVQSVHFFLQNNVHGGTRIMCLFNKPLVFCSWQKQISSSSICWML